jgi:hypothetical protein
MMKLNYHIKMDNTMAKKLETNDPEKWHTMNPTEKLKISKGETLDLKDKIKA